MPITAQKKNRSIERVTKAIPATNIRMEQEMITMREVDQWMVGHYKMRA